MLRFAGWLEVPSPTCFPRLDAVSMEAVALVDFVPKPDFGEGRSDDKPERP